MDEGCHARAKNSSMVYEEGFNDIGEDTVKVTLDERFADIIGGNNVTEMESNFNSGESE